MAELVKRDGFAPAMSNQPNTPENQFDGTAGEAIGYGDACYLAPDGYIYKAVGVSGTDASALVYGFASRAVSRAGRSLTLYRNVYFGYSNEVGAVVPGKRYYVSTTKAGALDDTANGKPAAIGALYGNIITTTTWDK